jgi:hypothetical protein
MGRTIDFRSDEADQTNDCLCGKKKAYRKKEESGGRFLIF